jgi:hypothetical protein
MIKTRKTHRPRMLELKRETIVVLNDDHLKTVAGGNKSTVPSQCVTLCF